MNYFAHARLFLDEPYVVAGTAVPDWLSVVNRRVRARGRLAAPFADDPDPTTSAIARGILQHHQDDAWFHQTPAFAALSLQFTARLRDLLVADDSFRPSFVGHILVELLLDAVLIADRPPQLDRYYEVLNQLDPLRVSRVVNRMVTQPTGMLSFFIPRFSAERFLYDYLDNEKLLFRLNHVMRRVRLPSLPRELIEMLPECRRAVQGQRDALLRGPLEPDESTPADNEPADHEME